MSTLATILRQRLLPPMPWPVEWTDLGRRCRTYPGDTNVLVGGSGSGKTQFAVQLARAFVAAGRGCVLWAPFELVPPNLSIRIAANLTRTHSMEIRDRWSELQIANAIATVTDRWRYVDARAELLDAQIASMDVAIDIATRIYGSPPLLVVDYVQRMITGEDARSATSDAMRAMTKLVERHACYGLVLSQTSRSNAPALAGRIEVESASDQIGAGAESSVLERDACNLIAMNVFKSDDSPTLDAHMMAAKCRNTGMEGKVGARYHKAGGFWEELDHLPATPVEVVAEVKRSKKRKSSGEDGGPIAAPEARGQINAGRADLASSARRAALVDALRRAGTEGLGARQLRRVKGSGSPRRMADTLVELERVGRVRSRAGLWVLIN